MTVVLSSGQRTIAVTVQAAFPDSTNAATRVAELALTQTGG